MFKKIITNLPYSPGLLNQIGFYTKRLKQEEFTRRLGLVFASLALVLNANLIIFSPEPSVLASPANDVIVGGIYGNSVEEIQNAAITAIQSSAATAAIFDFYGISETDVRSTTLTTINTANESYRSVGRQSFGRGGEVCYTHNNQTFCERSMYSAYRNRNLNVRALVGERQSKTNLSDRWFAIIESCGNVVIRTGNDEEIAVDKELIPQQATTVNIGDNINYRVRISALNENGAKNPSIIDNLPQHTSFVDYTPKDLFDSYSLDGNTLTLRSSGQLGPYETRVIDISVKVLDSAPNGSSLCNVVSATSLESTAVDSTQPCVTVHIPPPPTPTPTCIALRLLAGGSSNYTKEFEAEINPDGASINEYRFDFGDSQTQTVASSQNKVTIEHTYGQPGTYNVSVTASTSAGDVGGNDACQKTVEIVPPSPVPVVTCDYLNLLSRDERKLQFKAGGSAQDTTINSFEFDFGNGQTASVANDGNNSAETEITYDAAGDYTITVSVVGANSEIKTSAACSVDVTIEPEPCIYDETLSSDDPNCQPPIVENGTPRIVKRKLATNVTQEIDDAHNSKAFAGDVIEYKLVTENDGDAVKEAFEITEGLGDVLQYANVVDLDGGTMNDESKIVSWPAIDIAPGEIITKTLTIKVKSPIPNTPVAASDPLSFDLKMENAYGNNVTINLPPSTPKQVEIVAKDLPNTGPGMNIFLTALFFGTVTYFYSRNRMINKELHMIKADFSGGA